MLSRLACHRQLVSPTLLKSTLQTVVPKRQPVFGHYARDVKGGSSGTNWTARAERTTLRERAMAPPGPNAYAIGKGAVAGGAALGLGALCFGFGLGSDSAALENSHIWLEFKNQLSEDNYLHFGGSIVISAASALAMFRSPRLLKYVSRNGWMSILGILILALTFYSVMGLQSITNGKEQKKTARNEEGMCRPCGCPQCLYYTHVFRQWGYPYPCCLVYPGYSCRPCGRPCGRPS